MTGNTRRKGRVLVVDDDENLSRVMQYNLGSWGYDVSVARGGSDMDQRLATSPVDLVLLDVRLPDAVGIDLLPTIKQMYPSCQVVMVTAYGDVDMAMDALRLGAFDFQVKPIDLDRLRVSVQTAVKAARSHGAPLADANGRDPNDPLGEEAEPQRPLGAVRKLIKSVARSNCSVLITGETGSGKEVVAAEIHRLSKRRAHRLVTVNCAAIPNELLESEMFGHEQGAFTGATQRRIGSAEQAHESTLFLDEIGEMPMDLQAKLLRFLQEKTYTRVGGATELVSDARIIAATNRSPEEAVREGHLREDLLYRINVVGITVPPLRERREDIRMLAQTFLADAAAECEKPVQRLNPETMKLLMDYAWPGNVRHLKNVVHELVLLHDDEELVPSMLPSHIQESVERNERLKLPNGSTFSPSARILPMWQVEKDHLRRALITCNGNVAAAAERLEVSRATLYRKIKTYDLDASPDSEPSAAARIA